MKKSGSALDEMVGTHDVVTEFGGHKMPQKLTSLVLMSMGDST
ncbi:hypothetical protein ACYX34_06460 [Nitrospira sp. CMX1]